MTSMNKNLERNNKSQKRKTIKKDQMEIVELKKHDRRKNK